MDCNCQGIDIIGIIQTILSVSSLVVAWRIPVRIMQNQRYENLLQEYMGNDYAEALEGVIDFYVETCKSNVDLIAIEYNKLFNQKEKNNSEEDKNSEKNKNLQEDKFLKLHNQRRLLSYFFWQLNSCAKDSPSLRRKIKKEFTVNEAYICKILICMNKVLEDNPKIFKDISSIKYEKISGIRGINKSLFDFHNLLKNQNRWSD